jgi:hypothetical protein
MFSQKKIQKKISKKNFKKKLFQKKLKNIFQKGKKTFMPVNSFHPAEKNEQLLLFERR